jgi:hypothetical protein
MNPHTDSDIASGKVYSAFPILYFVDLIPEPSHHQSAKAHGPGVMLAAFQKAFEAAAESALLLQQEMIDIAQRNVNSSFCLLRQLAEAKSFGEIFYLQVAHGRQQLGALLGQAQELHAVSTKAAADVAEPIEAYKIIDDASKDLSRHQVN